MEDPINSSPDRVRLAFGAVLWRTFAVLAVLGEVALWVAIRKRARGFPPRLRLAWLIGYTPRTIFLAFFLAAVATVILDLFVRLVVDRLLRHWLSPATGRDDEDGRGFGFHLGATERVSDAIPGRRLTGLRSEPGSLVLTDQRLWFFPSAWDREPWSAPRDRIRSTSTRPAPGPMNRLLRGLPPRLLVDAGPGPDAQASFALADPNRALSWFRPEPAARRASGPSPALPG